MGVIETIALAMGVGWASGINLYAAVFMLGALHATGHIVLPPELAVVSDPLVLLAAAFMYCVEFFADKVPGVDTGWDALHTFVRIPAGAVLAAQAVGPVSAPVELAALLLGGTLAAGAHATKASTRVLLNASPEPVTNWTASVAEDALVVGGLWAALAHPVWFLVGLAAFLALAIWWLPRAVALIARGARAVGRLLRGPGASAGAGRGGSPEPTSPAPGAVVPGAAAAASARAAPTAGVESRPAAPVIALDAARRRRAS